MKTLRYVIIGLIAILSSLIFIGLMNDSLTLDSKHSIKKSKNFAFLMMFNLQKMSDWMPGFKQISMISGMPFSEGSVNELVLDVNGEWVEVEMIMKEFILNKDISIESHVKGYTVLTKVSFSKATDSKETVILVHNEITPNTFMARYPLIFAEPHIQRMMENSLNNYVDMVESM